jgi:glycerol-3-phosphate acyltransferase PlsY
VEGSLIAVVAIGAGYLAGSVPFSNVVAHQVRGADLRAVGTGTVSGTSLYRVAGFPALALGGVLDVAKGAVGPVLALGHPMAMGLAAGAAVVGHNWSVWLKGAGGRGISPAVGGLLVAAWPGAVVLLAGLILGRLLHQTALGALMSFVALVPVLASTHGWPGVVAAVAVVSPMLVKRATGNHPLPDDDTRPRVLTYRLLYDRDTPA